MKASSYFVQMCTRHAWLLPAISRKELLSVCNKTIPHGVVLSFFPLPSRKIRRSSMKAMRKLWLALLAFPAVGMVANMPAAEHRQQKRNLRFNRGDALGWWQPRIYPRGLMVGETPNIARIGQEGAMSPDYYAEESCPAGRNPFFPGMHPLRTGMIPP